MRKRMMQLAKGRFDYVGPNLSFSADRIEFEVHEQRGYSGSFSITSENSVLARGIVYSSNPRMEVLTPQFEGEEARIRFQFHSEGMIEGDNLEGEFYILCNLKEYSLPFRVSISRLYAESCIGKVTNLYEFTKLAKEDWKEAYQLFYSSNFYSLIKPKEVQESLVYRGISQAKPCDQNLEEFLIGIKKKERVTFQLSQTAFEFHDVTETRKETLEIRKNGWGYLELNISSDASFLALQKTHITSEDFLGNSFFLDYLIDFEQMHGGRNFGRITIEGIYQKVVVEIMVEAETEMEQIMTSVRTQIKECKVGIIELYQAYRLKRIVTGVWANETIDILNHLHALEPEETLYLLMKAQVYIINRQRQEAEWILNDFKRECTNHKSVEYGYYLYIVSLMEREPSYVDEITKEVELIFRDNPDSPFLFWILTFLQDQYYNNNGRKLKDISYWVNKGCTSPYLYLEAYYLIWQDPYLLTKLDSFEIKIMRWAIRHGALTKDIAIQVFEITASHNEFHPVIFEIMCASYQVNPKSAHLQQICSYLIKGQKFDTIYHPWFEKGIEEELRLTGLYEAFLLSLDPRDTTSVPKIIQMYFQYDTTLPYKKMAVLYNNIIAGKNKEKEIYQKYQKTMGRFAMEQAVNEHIDDNLAVLYEDMLDVGLINSEIAKGLATILFTHKLIVFDKHIVRAFVYQNQLKDPQVVSITNHEAYIQICSNEYVVVFEDRDGKRYSGSIQYQLQKLLNPEPYLERCMSLAGDELNYVISRFDSKRSYLTFDETDEPYFSRILFSNELSTDYLSSMVPEIIRYYKIHSQLGLIEQYLDKGDVSILTGEARKYIMELLVEFHLYEKAYDMIHRYGMEQIGSAAKITLCSEMIGRLEEQEDEFLTNLAISAFRAGKYNDQMLQYLAHYFVGNTDEMMKLWQACHEFELDCFELAERILVQMVYTNQIRTEAGEVFRYYYEHDGRELFVLAYISLIAHAYFVEDEKLDAYVEAIIESRFRYGRELNDACKLALFRYLADLEYPSDDQVYLQEVLLAEYSRRNMYFAFYKKLNKRLIQKYHLYDKVFLEYRTNPLAHVVLHFNGNDQGENFASEEMPNVYDGIYVKQFAMFFGDVIQYYISDEQNGKISVTESTRIVNNDLYGEKDNSRYNLINQMLIATTLQDDSSLYNNMKQYQGLESVVDRVFTTL